MSFNRQIILNYGPYTNSDLLMNYGFVEENNPYDYFTAEIVIEDDDDKEEENEVSTYLSAFAMSDITRPKGEEEHEGYAMESERVQLGRFSF